VPVVTLRQAVGSRERTHSRDRKEQQIKAIVVTEAGGKAQLREVPTPAPGPGQIRVRLAAAGVNPVDGKSASGAYGDVPSPFVPGTDGAGTVDLVGEGVTHFSVGDRVFGRLQVAMGQGTYAEYSLAPEGGIVAPIPAELDFVTAAALPVAGLTAMGLLEELELSPGAALLVVGATGGVGSFLTQLAARAGLEVIATAEPAFAPRIQELGARHTVDHHSSEPLARQVRALRPEGVDALVDLVGDRLALTPLLELLPSAAVVLSTAGGADEEVLRARGLSGGTYRRPATRQMLEELGGLVAEGKIRVPLERVLPLTEGPDVLAESTRGHLHGKTVLTIP
jgi:NADPH:quinone reductase